MILQNHGMQVNLTKSKLRHLQVEFMEFLLKKNGYEVTQKGVKAILRLAPPKTIKHVRTFVCTINFIKNHIPNRAAIMQPLTNLTKKNQTWTWKQEQQQAFEKILAAVANSILCIYPNPNKPFTLYPGASQLYAFGAVLTQRSGKNNEEITFGCYSYKIMDTS